MSTCMRRLRCLLICHALALAACTSAGDGAQPDAQLGTAAQADIVTGYTINPATGWADTGSTWTVGPTKPPSITGLGVGVPAPMQHRRTISMFSSSTAASPYTDQPLTEMIFPDFNIAAFPVPVEAGETLSSIIGRVRCTRSGAVTMQLLRRDVSGPSPTATQIGTAPLCVGGPEETLTVAGLSEVVDASLTQYELVFTQNNDGGVQLDVAYVTSF